jgi:cytosine/adenosine deaminase-related metal-dependent hydrolase
MAEPRRVLLRGGAVYSPADPFASAMLVAGAEVAWVGSEGAALAMADGVDEVVELAGALVVPAFVDAHLPEDSDASGAGRLGIGSVHTVGRVSWGVGGELGPVVVADDGSAAVIAALLDATADGLQAVVVAQDAAAVGRIARCGAPRGHRLHAAGGIDAADVPAIADSGLLVTLVAAPALPVAALAAAGVPFTFGSGPGAAGPRDPWEAVRDVVHHAGPDDRISARAAFAAHTRGGWRSRGMPGVGTLVPGAPAHYSIWSVGDLVVTAPDDRIAAWSTDPRSGTPGLPDLRDGATPPACVRTVVAGAVVHP